MGKRAAIVACADSGIGEASCAGFAAAGWCVVTTDMQSTPKARTHAYSVADLDRDCVDAAARTACLDQLVLAAQGHPVAALVDGAAAQVLGDSFSLTLAGLAANAEHDPQTPFLLVQGRLCCRSSGRRGAAS